MTGPFYAAESTELAAVIAEQEKYDLVFLEAAYANARIDLTDKVIKALDAGR